MKIVDVSQMLDDFSKTAAVIAEMDAIVTVDTAILHLAGAMGKRTIAMIAESCDWRWGLNGSKTDWYPSVTLIRKEGDDWSTAFSTAANLLREMP
jgi:ADP-heptose:LPS heptosyltransferase